MTDAQPDADAQPTATARPEPAAAGDSARAFRALRDSVAVAVVDADEPLRLLASRCWPTATSSSRTSRDRQDAARAGGRPGPRPPDGPHPGHAGPPSERRHRSSIFEGGRLRFVAGPVFTNILLVDEINRATPRTQSALLEAMQERQVSVEGATRPLPEPFVVLATQNPIEYEGTFSLPEAQLDRFLVRIGIGYPAGRRSGGSPGATRRGRAARGVSPVADGAAILACATGSGRSRSATRSRPTPVAIVHATRTHADLQLGGSPRASGRAVPGGPGRGVPRGPHVRPAGRRPGDRPGRPRPSARGRPRPSLHGATADRILADIVAGVPVPVDPAYDRAG